MIDNEALARSAVACMAWRWMAGMLAYHRHCGGVRLLVDDHGEGTEKVVVAGPTGNRAVVLGDCGVLGGFPSESPPYSTPFVPDLADPATLGCVLALVREAWGASGACVVGCSLDGWRFWLGDGYREHEERYPTEAEALVAALEAAPVREVKP